MFYWRPPWNISIFLLRISLDRFDGSTGYYLYDARGSVSGITNEEGQVYQSYRYSVTGEITFGAPQYENEYTYNGESYNPNIESQYLRARYYCVVTATFLTEDSYLGNQTEPLTLNRYNYCVSSYLNYTDPSGNSVEINIPFEEFEQAQTYGDIYRLLEKYIIIEAQRMEAEHNATEQEMLNGMQRDYDSGFMKAIMELESDIGISGIYNIVVSPLRYAYQGSSDPYGEAIRNRRQNSQNFYVGVAQFGFDIVDPITHPELITGRIYSGMFAVTNDPGILFQDPMGPALDAWDAVWTDDDQTHFNKTGYLFGQILAAVGLGCAKSCIDEGLANTTTRTGAIEDRKGTVYGVAESGSSSRYDRTGYQSKGRSNNLFGRDRSTRRTTNLTEWRRSISQQDIHNEMRLFLGDDYVKIDSGKWRSLDGTRQFRVKPDDYLGNHGIGQPTVPNTPHVHFEFLTPKSNGNGFDVIKNIHVPIK